MLRILPLLFLAAGLLAAPTAAAKKVWRPKPIFTPALCNEELKLARKTLAEKLKAAKVKVPAPTSRDTAVNGAYAEFLTNIDRAVGARAKSQARAAGKWKGQTRYEIVKWQGRKYRITSCQQAKLKIPLNRALRVVTGVKEPPPSTTRSPSRCAS